MLQECNKWTVCIFIIDPQTWWLCLAPSSKYKSLTIITNLFSVLLWTFDLREVHSWYIIVFRCYNMTFPWAVFSSWINTLYKLHASYHMRHTCSVSYKRALICNFITSRHKTMSTFTQSTSIKRCSSELTHSFSNYFLYYSNLFDSSQIVIRFEKVIQNSLRIFCFSIIQTKMDTTNNNIDFNNNKPHNTEVNIKISRMNRENNLQKCELSTYYRYCGWNMFNLQLFSHKRRFFLNE